MLEDRAERVEVKLLVGVGSHNDSTAERNELDEHGQWA
jgi:hypothetical protein